MTKTFNIVAGEDLLNVRLDKAISEKLKDTARSYVQKLIDQQKVFVNGQNSIPKNYKVRMGDEIKITVNPPEDLETEPENIPLDIMYEDDDLLIVNKPKGMVVHPAAGNYTGTLVNALLYHCGDSLSGINGTKRPGIVHRIDKDTSGLLIVAKNDFSHKNLAIQIKEHSFKREYEAVVYGVIAKNNGTINAPIGRSRADRKKMTVTEHNSKNAVTHFTVIERSSKFTYLRLQLETGRTHQIRVHMAHIGHPVAGDQVYGPKKVLTELNGQCLHARLVGFIHPRTNEYMEFCSELPEYFKKFYKLHFVKG